MRWEGGGEGCEDGGGDGGEEGDGKEMRMEVGMEMGKEMRMEVKYLVQTTRSFVQSHPPSQQIGNRTSCTCRIRLAFDFCLPDKRARCTP